MHGVLNCAKSHVKRALCPRGERQKARLESGSEGTEGRTD